MPFLTINNAIGGFPYGQQMHRNNRLKQSHLGVALGM